MTDHQVCVGHQWQIQPIIMSASTVLVPPLVWSLRFRFGSVPREGYWRYELGVEGRRTLVEESGFILLLISPGNRERHVSSRSGIYKSHGSPRKDQGS